MKKVVWLALAALLVTGLTLTSCKAGGSKKSDKGGKSESAEKKDEKKDEKKADESKGGAAMKAGEILFKFKPADGAETVNIAGSFQGWNPSDPNYAMELKGDTFQLKIELEAGKYMWKFVIDGNWVQSMEDYKDQFSPDQAVYVDDGFGGKNCILEVE